MDCSSLGKLTQNETTCCTELMLSDLLQSVRLLLDEAYEAGELKHATTLGKLSSTIESAILHQDDIESRFVERERIVAVLANGVARLLALARERLSADEFEVVQITLSEVIPQPLAVDPEVQSIERVLGYMKSAFDEAVKTKAVGELNRVGQMIVTKAKLLQRHKLRAGILIDAEQAIALVDASKNAMPAVKRVCKNGDTWDDIVDTWLVEQAA